ncbi:MAG: biopolymer transporter ExbD [Desulfobacterales bacterium]|nr:MAG: biopolymer transporter ExbD [Desulfobacterales bacterium]
MRFRRADEEEFRPELTPLVDVVFQLIIFFMVSTVFVDFTRQMEIALPQSAGKPAQELAAQVTIEITEAQKVFLNGTQLPLEALGERLQSATGTQAVLIRADRRLPYGIVMQVMELCEKAGVTDIRTAVQ